VSNSARLDVRVTPRSSRDRIEVAKDGAIKIWVTAAPTDGQANKAVCDLLAKKLGVPKSAVGVARGATSREKQIAIDGLTQDRVLALLASQERP
jgi:uncharacterized protein (TIGR00251 family)